MNLILILTMMRNRYLRGGLFMAAFRGGLTKALLVERRLVNKSQGLADWRRGAISKNLWNVPAADVCHALDDSCSRVGVAF